MKKTFIGAFCVFHMFAIALYAVPGVLAETRVVKTLRHHFNDSTRPYVLITSQWQHWPLFAPDPARRVSRLEVDTYNRETGEWVPYDRMTEETITFWRHSRVVKMRENLHRDDRKDIRQRHMELECRHYEVPPDTPIRIRYRYHIIPKNVIQQSADWWRDWEPDWQEYVDMTTYCSPARP